MNELEQQLHYPLGETLPAPGTALAVAPGILWVRMPLPFALDHINLWLLRDRIDGRDGWTLVDCGIDNAATRGHWEAIFDSGCLDGLPVLRIIVTHFHPDHLGAAHWLCAGGNRGRWQAGVWMSFGEYTMARLLTTSDDPGVNIDVTARDFARHGVTDPAALSLIDNRASRYRRLVPAMPARFRRIADGQVIEIGGRAWRVITGFGHSVEHCALHCEELNLLIAGDMVLPRISTNISVTPLEPDGDPLAGFLWSIERYRPLHADALVLPSHGKPFTGLHTRLDQLHAHHDERLDEIRAVCARTPHSAADIIPVMFRRALDAHQLRFALGEALAHLNRLWHAGELEKIDDGKVIRFAAKRRAHAPARIEK